MGKSHAIVPKGWVKVSEFEALTGLNNRTVTLAIKRGGIPPECWRRVGEGKTSPICIDPKPAAVHWYRHVNGTHHLTQPLRGKLAVYIRTFDRTAVEDQEGGDGINEGAEDQGGMTVENGRIEGTKDEGKSIESEGKTDGKRTTDKGTGVDGEGETEGKNDSSTEGKKGTGGIGAKKDDGGDKMTFAEAQRRKEVAKAKTAELELLEKQGTLILKQRVQDQLFNAGKELRDALLAVPDRVTDEILAAGDNRTKVNNIIYDAIAGELERLADLYIK